MTGRKVPDEGDPRGLYSLGFTFRELIGIVIAIAGFPHSRGGSPEITGTSIQRDPTFGLAFWTAFWTRWTDQISFLATGDSVITVYPPLVWSSTVLLVHDNADPHWRFGGDPRTVQR